MTDDILQLKEKIAVALLTVAEMVDAADDREISLNTVIADAIRTAVSDFLEDHTDG
jgi:predicted HicB family RNase H-like nuclease